MLEIRNLRFAYPGMAQPYDFSLDVPPGMVTLIAGRSGSGKSTLLDLIAGFQVPLSGTLTLDGADLLPLPPEVRPVSILFQRENLFDHLSVRDNLALGLPSDLSASVIKKRVNEALAQVDMPEFANRLASALSGGQQQRVALARNLLRNRPVLLLDEPFSNLDRATADEMRALIKKLTRDHAWHTLIVSHQEEDAEGFADRAYWLEDSVLALSA